jgi:signal transduction histidine kinase
MHSPSLVPRHQDSPIDSYLNQPLRTERLIAAARVSLGLVFLFALLIDPSDPAEYAVTTFALTVVYLFLSACVLIWLKLHDRLPAAFPVWIQAIEILWIGALSLLSNGPASPFVIAFIFVIFASAYRWRLKATLLTGSVVVALMIAEGVLLLIPSQLGFEVHGDFKINRLMMRVFYMALTAGFAGLLSESQKRLFVSSMRVSNLLAGIDLKGRFSATLEHVMREIGSHFKCEKTVLLIEQLSAGRTFDFEVLSMGGEPGRSACWRESSPLLTEDLGLQPTSAALAELRGSTVVVTSIDPNVKDTISVNLFKRFDVSSLIAAPVEVEDFRGRLLLLSPHVPSEVRIELRALKHLLDHILPAVFNVYLSRRLHARATAMERTRVARELHDGSIQSLISLGMQIDVMRKNTTDIPPKLADDLQRIQGLVRQEVLNLRALMTNLQTVDVDAAELVEFVAHLVEQWKRETGIEASFISQADGIFLPPSTCKEVARIVQEALTNIRKHSGARQVSVKMLSSDQGLDVIIEDNGRGFGFAGRLDQQALRRAGKGPAILSDRVRAIGGSLAIDSSHGARLEISIPYQRTAERKAAQA